MDKSKIYLDLSKCTEEEQKHIFSLLPESQYEGAYEVYTIYKYLHYNESYWFVGADVVIYNRTELTYPEFIKLFEGGEGKEVLKVENNRWIKIESTDQRYPEEDVWVCSSHATETVFFHQAFAYISRDFTHYKPIVKPLPPKF